MNEYRVTNSETGKVFVFRDSHMRPLRPDWGPNPTVVETNIDAVIAQEEADAASNRAIVKAIRAAANLNDIKQILVAMAKLIGHQVD